MGVYRGIGGTGDSTSDANYAAVTAKAVEAAASAAAADTSADAAAASATSAQGYANAASDDADAAATSASSASSSASAALAAKTAAETAETNAETAETNAETAEAHAETAQAAAETAQAAAETAQAAAAASATNASSSASSASTSASTATTQAGIATTKASEASTSATNAATSETNAATSASTASAAKDAALAALDSFDDRYLGSKATAPTVDNDGNALASGALYFNTSTNEMKVYDGTQWLNAYASLSGALLATSNLSDLNNVSTARSNLGVTATGSDTTYAYRANNLSDLASASTARTNLGLGTAATTAATDYATAAQGTAADTAYTDRLKWDGGSTGLTAATGRTSLGVTATGSDTTYAYRANNLSDLASAATARTNLGLGTAATTAATAYATAAQGTKADSALQTNSALGTPASGNLANCTFPTLNQNTTGSSGSCTGNATTATTATYVSATQQVNTITGKQASMSMSQDGGATVGSFICKATGTGDSNLAGMTFLNDAYGIKLGIRADGYFGLGGYSRTAWSWYSGPDGSMVAAGNVTAYSDEKLKKNWRDLPSDFVEQLAEVKHGVYDRIDEEITQIGVSAQSLQKVMPDAVMMGLENTLTVAYGNAALTSAVQLAIRVIEQDKRIAKLEEALSKLIGE